MPDVIRTEIINYGVKKYIRHEMTTHEHFDRIANERVVAIVRGVGPDRIVNVVEAIADGGVGCIEITADSPEVLTSLRQVTDVVDDDLLIGVGTVLDSETAVATLRAGAEFIVTPTLSEEVIDVGNRYGALVAPGVQTPTEAQTAFEAGADVVKLFPAGPLGPDYVSALTGPLEQIPIVPTGGISAENAPAYLEAGATAVGVGSAIVDDEALEAGDFDRIRRNAEDVREVVSE